MKTEGPGELWISGPLLLDFLPLPRYAGSIKNTEAILLLSFASDYIAGAHPEILRRLAATGTKGASVRGHRDRSTEVDVVQMPHGFCRTKLPKH